jgi:hypothetical protein
MKYYEIKNRKTQETAQTTAKNFATACKANGWRPPRLQVHLGG